MYCVAILGDTAGEIAEIHNLLGRCIGSPNFSLRGAERCAFLTFAKPSNGTAVFENDATIHTPKLEEGEEGAFHDSIANLQTERSRERDVHNHPQQKHIGGRINSFNSCARGVLFLHVRILVTKEITEETAVIFYLRVDQSRKAVRVDAINVRLVVLLVARVVYHECIRSGGTANHNTIHGVGLVLGALLVPVLYVMEVTEGKQRNPCAFIIANAVNKEER
jgi:hypothetical protein